MNFLSEFGFQIQLVLVLYIATLLLVLCDLWSGCRKARERGEYRSSRGLRKTVTKLTNYYNMLLALTVIDGLVTLVSMKCKWDYEIFPFVTLVGVLFIAYIEIKSIFEKADKKQRAGAEDALNTLIAIARNRDDLEKMLEAIKSKKAGNEDQQ